jgi:hypothetical protein
MTYPSRRTTIEIEASNTSPRRLPADGDLKRIETIALFEGERIIVIRDEQLEELHLLVNGGSSAPYVMLTGQDTPSLELVAAVDSTWIDMTLEAEDAIESG